MKPPPGNVSQEAIALREAASEWAAHSRKTWGGVDNDPHDKKGQRLNRRLLAAAVVYAESLEPASEDVDVAAYMRWSKRDLARMCAIFEESIRNSKSKYFVKRRRAALAAETKPIAASPSLARERNTSFDGPCDADGNPLRAGDRVLDLGDDSYCPCEGTFNGTIVVWDDGEVSDPWPMWRVILIRLISVAEEPKP